MFDNVFIRFSCYKLSSTPCYMLEITEIELWKICYDTIDTGFRVYLESKPNVTSLLESGPHFWVIFSVQFPFLSGSMFFFASRLKILCICSCMKG